MKNEILNIIDIEEITKVRNSINSDLTLPKKNALVSLIPIEFLEKGVKVLIDGKLFIAFIDENIPLKEEIIAIVTNSYPFTLSLNFNYILNKSKNNILAQILKKLQFKDNPDIRKLIVNIILEEKPLIRSKILLLNNLYNKHNVQGLELSLLINLVWDNANNNFLSISDLYEDLFDESFDNVSEKLFTVTKELLFTDISPIILHQFNSELIYSDKENNTQAITGKSEILLKIIKSINETYGNSKSNYLEEFIRLSSIYILQKSVLKEYHYYPDFVVVRQNGELILVKYNIKKTFSINDVPIYKLQFKHNKLPFELSGIIRNGFLLANMNLDEESDRNISNELDSFSENLKNQLRIGSKINTYMKDNTKLKLEDYKTGFNKLIS